MHGRVYGYRRLPLVYREFRDICGLLRVSRGYGYGREFGNSPDGIPRAIVRIDTCAPSRRPPRRRRYRRDVSPFLALPEIPITGPYLGARCVVFARDAESLLSPRNVPIFGIAVLPLTSISRRPRQGTTTSVDSISFL